MRKFILAPVALALAVIAGLIGGSAIPTLAQTRVTTPTGVLYLRNMFAGTGSQTYIPSGVIFTGISTATCGTATLSNGTTVETDVCTYSLPANTLSANGNKVRITAYGTAAANANAKNARLYFGATAVSNLGTSINTTGWMVTAVVTRTAATTQVAGSLGLGANGASIASQSTAPAATLSGAVVIKTTLQSATASNDLTLTSMFVEVLP